MADGTIVINTRIDDSGAEQGVNRLGSIASKGLGIATKAAKLMAVGVTATASAVGVLAKKCVDQYAIYEQMSGGVETLFKNSSNKVMEYANNAYKTAGLSANEYMNTITGFSASLLQGLGGDTAKAAEIGNQAVIDMSDNANKMGTAMQDIQNAYQGFAKGNMTMLDNLKLGYAGTKSEMERLLADAEKVSGIHYDISNFGDIINAIHVIQQNMGITGTTAKEAATTIEGSLNMTKAAWTNLMTGMADDNANFDQLINNFVNSATSFGNNILPRIEIALTGIGKLIDSLLPVIMGKIPGLITNIFPKMASSGVKIISSLGNGLLQALPTLIPMALNILQQLTSGMQTALPQILQVGIQILQQLILGIAQQLPTLIPIAIECILDLVNGLLNNVDKLINAGIQLIFGLAQGLINALPMLIERVPVIINNLWNAFDRNAIKILKAGIKLIVMLAKGLIQAIPILLKNLPEIVKAIVNTISHIDMLNLGKKLITKLGSGIRSMGGSVVSWCRGIGERILSPFRTLKSKFVEIGSNLIKGLWNGIKSVKNWVFDKIKGFCGGIVDKVKHLFGIRSPSRVFRDEIGKYLAQGIGVGFTLESNIVSKDMLNSLKDNTKDLYGALRSAVDIETARTTAQVVNNKYNGSGNIVNNDNGITQNVTIVSPERTPSENARAIKKAGRDLAWTLTN